MPDRLATANIDIDPELIPGAHNAVSVCLQLTPEERVTIITDKATCDIAAALRAEDVAVRSMRVGDLVNLHVCRKDIQVTASIATWHHKHGRICVAHDMFRGIADQDGSSHCCSTLVRRLGIARNVSSSLELTVLRSTA